MKCDDALRALSLYEYGELDAPTEENLESHLHACASCEQEWQRQRAMSQALSQREIEPSAALLEQCRQELTRSLYREGDRPAAS
jgi:anti-sigma factor RsiW